MLVFATLDVRLAPLDMVLLVEQNFPKINLPAERERPLLFWLALLILTINRLQLSRKVFTLVKLHQEEPNKLQRTLLRRLR